MGEITRLPEPLWREVLGARLRRLRRQRRLTLTQLARLAGVSPQYLSEIERGRKEPSSEMIAAVSGALGLSLIGLTAEVAAELQRAKLTFIDFTGSSAHPHPPASSVQDPVNSTQLSLVA